MLGCKGIFVTPSKGIKLQGLLWGLIPFIVEETTGRAGGHDFIRRLPVQTQRETQRSGFALGKEEQGNGTDVAALLGGDVVEWTLLRRGPGDTI